MTVHALTPNATRYARMEAEHLDLEQQLLGALLTRPDAAPSVRAILDPEHFGEDLHGKVYTAILAAIDAGQPPTMATVKQFLGDWNCSIDLGDGVTITQYMARMMAYAAVVPLVPIAGMIRDLWGLRQLAALGDDIANDNSGFDPAAKLSERFTQIDKIRSSLQHRERTSSTAGQAADVVVARIEAVLQGNAPPLPKTGLYGLDEELGGGLQPSSLIVIAARTSMGKSALGIEVADTVARQGFGCVYHSLEMPSVQVASRQISSRLERGGIRLPYQDIIRGRVADPRAERGILDIRRELQTLPLQIEEAGGVTIADIAASSERRINAFVRKGIKPGVVVIDHVHQVKAMRRDRTQEGDIREASAGALALAKHLTMPVLLLAQLNRQTEGREDHRPGPADLRG